MELLAPAFAPSAPDSSISFSAMSAATATSGPAWYVPRVAVAPAAAEERELEELEHLLSSGPPSARHKPAAPAAAPLGPPPSRAEIAVMPVQAAVRCLEQCAEHERVVDAVCDRWRALSYGPARRQSAAEAGALNAIVIAMRIHIDAPSIQELCCLAIGNIVAGVDESGVARKQLAADAGCLEALANAIQAHVDASSVQEYGAFALGNICYAADQDGLKRKQRAADACAVSALIRGMRAHSGEAAVAEYGCFALGNICRAVGGKDGGTDESGRERKAAAVDAGALGVIVNAMRFHSKESGVQEWGARALSNITFGNNEWREKARQAGARPQWLVGMAEAMEEIEKNREVPGNSKTERLAIRAPQPRASATARPARRAPRIAPSNGAGGAGKMVPLPAAGPLWR